MSYSTLRGVRNLDTLHALPSQWASDFSEEVHVTAAVDTVAPLTPSSFAIAGIAEGITLTWVNPTLNDDGNPCYDLSDIAVYRSESASIVITDDETYDKKTLVGTTEAYTYPASDTTKTYYFVITAIDTSGNESAASAELSDTSNTPIGTAPVIPDDANGLIFKDSIGGDGVVEGYAMMGIAFQTPPSSVVGLRSIRLWFQYTDDAGTNWRDEDGNVDPAPSSWDSGTYWTELFPEGLIGCMHKDVLMQTNIGTRAYRYSATFIGEDDTTESSIPDTAGGSTTVCAANNNNLVAISIFAMNIVCLGEVVADSIKANAITGDKISSATTITAGTGNDVGVLDGADATYRIYAGHATPASAPFRVTKAGKLFCTGADIRGTLVADDIDSGTMNFARISPASVEIIATMMENNSVGSSAIVDGAVTVNKLNINDTVVFKDGATYHNITGCDYITKDIAAHQWLDLGNGLWEVSLTNSIQMTSGVNKDFLIYSGGDLRLDSEDDLIVQVNASSVLTITGIVATDSVSLKIGHEGLITCDVGGATRYIAFREEA